MRGEKKSNRHLTNMKSLTRTVLLNVSPRDTSIETTVGHFLPLKGATRAAKKTHVPSIHYHMHCTHQ